MTSRISIYIVDDHQMLIDGIKALLADEPEFNIIGEATRCTVALENLKKLKPDVIITDINMPEMSGIEFTKAVHRSRPDLKVLALSMFGEKSTITEMMQAGVSGYILKNTGKKELITALRDIHAGKKHFSQEVQDELKKEDTGDLRMMLTSREKDIIRLVAQGMSHTEIGERLFISPRTVDTHRTNIMRKLEVKSIAELVKIAMQHKIIE